MLKIGLRTLSILACTVSLTGCFNTDEATISSRAITVAKVGEEYRYEITIKDGTLKDINKETSSYPDWLQLELSEPLKDLSKPLVDDQVFSFT